MRLCSCNFIWSLHWQLQNISVSPGGAIGRFQWLGDYHVPVGRVGGYLLLPFSINGCCPQKICMLLWLFQHSSGKTESNSNFVLHTPIINSHLPLIHNLPSRGHFLNCSASCISTVALVHLIGVAFSCSYFPLIHIFLRDLGSGLL